MIGICYQRWDKQPRGRAQPRALTSDQARTVRLRHGNGESVYTIAQDLGVAFRTVEQIVEWRTYRDAL